VELAERLERRELRLPLGFSGDEQGTRFDGQGRTLDVSGTGLLMETRHALQVGQRLLIELHVPQALQARFEGREVYRVLAVVRRVDDPGQGALFQVATELLGEPGDP